MRAFYDHGNALIRLLLEMFGVGVGLEVVFLDHFQNARSRSVADVRVVVDDAGDSSHRIPGLTGNVFDRHSMPLFLMRNLVFAQPLTAPATTPSMIYFWQIR